MSLTKVYLKYRERRSQGYDFTPVGELISDLYWAMSKQQYESAMRQLENKRKETANAVRKAPK